MKDRALKPQRVLFVCVHNSGRSQMAEALLNHLAGGRYIAESMGTLPSERINPVVAQVMKEVGINIEEKRPKMITQEAVDRAGKVITMGCSIEEACPANLVLTEDWGLEDPEGKPIEQVRKIRDEIGRRVRKLAEEL